MNTPENPITHGGEDRGYKFCLCSECGMTAQCTPRFDFYTRTEAGPNGPLVCERCIMKPYDPARN